MLIIDVHANLCMCTNPRKYHAFVALPKGFIGMSDVLLCVFRLERCRQTLKDGSPKAKKRRHEDIRQAARNTSHSVLSCKSLHQGIQSSCTGLANDDSACRAPSKFICKVYSKQRSSSIFVQIFVCARTLVNTMRSCPSGAFPKGFIACQTPCSSRLPAGTMPPDAQRSLTNGEKAQT